MGTNNRESLLLKAWVRYDGNGEIIPGSIVYRKRKPAGKFKELIDPSSYDPCCPVVYTTTIAPSCTSAFWEAETESISAFEYANSIVADNSCNTYTAILDSGTYAYPEYEPAVYSSILITKRDASGAIVWNKIYAVVPPGGYSNVGNLNSLLYDDTDDSVYILGGNVNYKLSASDGSVIWRRYYLGFPVRNGVINPVDKSLYFVCFYGNGGAFMKIDKATGDAVFKEINISIPGVDSFSLEQLTADQDGNMYHSWGYYVENDSGSINNYPGGYIKFDWGANPIWANYFTITPQRDYSTNYYQDLEPMVPTTDKYGAVYASGWNIDLIKMDKDGQILFDYVYYSTLVTAADPAEMNNIAVSGNNLWFTLSVTTNFYDTINPNQQCTILVNADLQGNVRWATAIVPSNISNFSYRKKLIAKDGAVYFILNNQDVPSSFYYELKLPDTTTQITGTIGSFDYVDVTSFVARKGYDTKTEFFPNVNITPYQAVSYDNTYTLLEDTPAQTNTVTTITP